MSYLDLVDLCVYMLFDQLIDVGDGVFHVGKSPEQFVVKDAPYLIFDSCIGNGHSFFKILSLLTFTLLI